MTKTKLIILIILLSVVFIFFCGVMYVLGANSAAKLINPEKYCSVYEYNKDLLIDEVTSDDLKKFAFDIFIKQADLNCNNCSGEELRIGGG